MSNPVRAFIVVIAVTAAVGAIAPAFGPKTEPAVTDERVGQAAPEFSLPVLDGEGRLALADHRGEVVVLDFWATHCAPCRRSIPHVERLRRRYADQGVSVVSINVDFPEPGRDELVRAFVRNNDMAPGVLMDDGRTAYAYGAARIPLLIMVDRDGVMRRVYRGYTEYAVLADGLDAILEGGRS